MITGISTVGINVSDQQRALDFYTTKLGFELLQDAPMTPEAAAPRWLVVGIPGADTGLLLFTPPGQEDRIGGFGNIVFGCDDIAATHAELSARGVEFTSPPERQSWGMWAVFADPDGNNFGLSQPDTDL